MDFSIQTVFILPSDNTLPTTGTTANLTPGQFGVYLPNYVPATGGTIANAKWIQLFQGRLEQFPDQRTKRSDKIKKSHVFEWYKVEAEDTARVQITDISDIVAHCGETITVSLRLFSYYVNASYFNGLTRSFTLSTPCCACDADPCATLTADEIQALVDEWVTQINGDQTIGKFISASRVGAGATSILRLTGIPLDKYGNPCDVRNYPYNFDKLKFDTWIYKGAPTTQDAPFYVNYDNCDLSGTVEVTQTSTYPRGSSEQVRQVEINTWSYQATMPGKELFSNSNFNGAYTSYVEDGTFYDLYVIKCYNPEGTQTWSDFETQDFTVQIFVPVGDSADLETLLEAYLGTVEDESGVDISTTTSTSSSSTTSTTTTQP